MESREEQWERERNESIVLASKRKFGDEGLQIIKELLAIKKAAEEVVKMRHAGYPQFLGNALNDLELALSHQQTPCMLVLKEIR